MKQQILFIQGGGDGAYKVDQELVTFLRSALGSAYELRYPKMPHENDPNYELWKTRILKELATVEGAAILIRHSLGGSFLLKYISEEKIETTIAGIFLIAAPYWAAMAGGMKDMSVSHCQMTLLRNCRVERQYFFIMATTTRACPSRTWRCMQKNCHGRLFEPWTEATISLMTTCLTWLPT